VSAVDSPLRWPEDHPALRRFAKWALASAALIALLDAGLAALPNHLRVGLHAAGTTVNPLEHVALSRRLLFFDGRDPDQVGWARALQRAAQERAKPILTRGSPVELIEAWGTWVGYLYEHATRPEYRYRHRWRIGDLVMFDNRCLMHYVAVDYPASMHRLMHRTTAAGTRPRGPGEAG